MSMGCYYYHYFRFHFILFFPIHVWNKYGTHLFIFILFLLSHTCLKWVWESIYFHFHYLAPYMSEMSMGIYLFSFSLSCPHMSEVSMGIYLLSFYLSCPIHVWNKYEDIFYLLFLSFIFPILIWPCMRQDNKNKNKKIPILVSDICEAR